MKQRGGCLWLLVGLFLAILAGGLAFTAMLKATSAQPADQVETRAPVVVVARNVPPRTELKAEDLITKDLPLSAIPDNAVREQKSAIGKITVSDLVAGEILLEPRIATPGEPGPRVAFKVDPGKVVMAFPADDLMSRAGVLMPGDIIDILYSIQVPKSSSKGSSSNETETVTFWTLQQIPITAVVLPADARKPSKDGSTNTTGGPPESILLAVDPQDALLLKYLKDTNGIADIVLRAREDDTEYETEPINRKHVQDQYDLTPERLR
ncbi:MAG: Flp pilus assembly protein CpaB [Chloroflexi bacterium]|nr:MAG: Flp pilus assembly protein CpaB [Chloroflexota bacterium]